jgi:hypothetical protein
MKRNLRSKAAACNRSLLASGTAMIFVVLGPYFIACSTTISLSSHLGYDEFNRAVNNKNAQVVLITKEEIQATDVKARDGFLYWTDRTAGREQSIVFDSVDRVYVGERHFGAARGFVYGFATPVGLSAALLGVAYIGYMASGANVVAILMGDHHQFKIKGDLIISVLAAGAICGAAGAVIGSSAEGNHISLSNSEKTHSIAIYCSDGRVVTGILTQLVPNKHIIIRDSKGEIEKFEWSEISKYEETGVAKP